MDPQQQPINVIVTGVNVSIGDLAVLWFKLVIAAIPTALIFAIIAFIVTMSG